LGKFTRAISEIRNRSASFFSKKLRQPGVVTSFRARAESSATTDLFFVARQIFHCQRIGAPSIARRVAEKTADSCRAMLGAPVLQRLPLLFRALSAAIFLLRSAARL
jgi:hypothetical protein